MKRKRCEDDQRRGRGCALVIVGIAGSAAIGAALRLAKDIAGRQRASAGTPGAAAPPPMPAVLVVARTHTRGSALGDIHVVEVPTGSVLGSLGRESTIYLQDGFQLSADRSVLYFTRLTEAAQTIHIVAAPLDGEAPHVVVAGANHQLSPDGR